VGGKPKGVSPQNQLRITIWLGHDETTLHGCVYHTLMIHVSRLDEASAITIRMGQVVEVTSSCWHHDAADAGTDGTWDALSSLCYHAPDAKVKPLCMCCRSNSAWETTFAGVYGEYESHI